MQEFHFLINGQLVTGSAAMPVMNPAMETSFAHSPVASSEQLDAAVVAARRAFPSWRSTPFEERRKLVLDIAQVIHDHKDELAWLLTRENGKPLNSAKVEIDSAIEYTRYFATLELAALQIEDSPLRRVEIQRVPLGVVAAIVPWNFPLLLLAFKLPPALLAGNTVVIKPATSTPLTTLKLAELLAQRVPRGVINVIAGTDDLGPLLTQHPLVNKVSFTGSTATGKSVMQSCAANLTRVTLELGGNDPAIVLADVDPIKVAASLFGSAFGNSGQVCRAVKRVYAHSSIYEALCEALAEKARRAVVGDGAQTPVDFGPVHNKAQYERIKGLLQEAQSEGTVLTGEALLEGPGYFVRPTIVKDLPPDSRLVLEEQFGPILPVLSFDDLGEAIDQANATPYGLAASVWSRDLKKAHFVADRLEAGTVWINKHIDRTPHLPIAGAKHSGMGVELGQQGLEEFTQIKVINASDLG